MRTPSPGSPGDTQSFGGVGAVGSFPPQTGAVEVNTLGYEVQRASGQIENMDAVYHFSFTFDHTTPRIGFVFQGLGLQGVDDESWGLDNVKVFATPPNQ